MQRSMITGMPAASAAAAATTTTIMCLVHFDGPTVEVGSVKGFHCSFSRLIFDEGHEAETS